MIRVLVVPADADEPARLARVSGDHDTFAALVDDLNTDTVFFSADDADGLVKVAANGKALATHAPNPRATQVLERFLPGFASRDRVEGPAVFVGLDAQTGDLSDVSATVAMFAGNLFSVDTAAD